MTRRNPRREAEDRRAAQVQRQLGLAEQLAAAEQQAAPAPVNFSAYADLCRDGQGMLAPEPEAG